MSIPVRRIHAAGTSWPFLISLVVLLLNDTYLKHHYAGLLTGKLSDFSGIFLVSLILFALLPRWPYSVSSVVVATFVWWKSPLSDKFIWLVHTAGGAGFGRIVDYTDLFALTIVPLAYVMGQRVEFYQISMPTLRRVLAIPMLLIAFLATLGTSVIRLHQNYEVRETNKSDEISAPLAADMIRSVAEGNGLKCISCERLTETAKYGGGSITLEYAIKTDRIVFHISGLPGFPLFSRIPGRMDALKHDLNRQLGMKFKNLEFAAPLWSGNWGEMPP
jgi:hypothetical protein